jgi:hypothetical protein
MDGYGDFPGGTSMWIFVAVAALMYVGYTAEKRQQKRDAESFHQNRNIKKPTP